MLIQMKTLAFVFILIGAYLVHASENVTSEVVTASPPDNVNIYGNCSTKEYMQNLFPCETSLIHALQRNENCRSSIDKSINCTIEVQRNCSTGWDESEVRKDLNQRYTEKLMCEMAGFGIGNVSSSVSVPCSITTAEYVKEINKCHERMVKLWKADRSDPELCREYIKRKQCVKQLINTKCNFTGVQKTTLDMQLGNFNPFCPSGFDPTSVDPTSVDPTSVDPTSVDPTSVDPESGALSGTSFGLINILMIVMMIIIAD